VSAAIDRSRPPAAGPRHSFAPPEPRRLRLANGFEVLLVPRPGIPRFEVSLLFPAGGERNPADRPGLASFTGALLDEGTAKRSGTEIALALEGLGATLSTGADWDTGHADLTLFSRDLETGLRALAEVTLEPAFPESEVERIRRQTLAEILRRRDQPGVLADEALADQLYRGTPYGALLLGTRESLEGVERARITAFHSETYDLGSAKLVMAGDFDPDRACELADQLFGGPAAPSAKVAPPILAGGRGRRVIVVDLPDAAQSELRIGQVGVPRTHPDRARLGVLNALFGGKFTSRLNLNLRERHGFTYGVSSRFVDRRGPGPFVIGAAVANDVVGAAAREVFAELHRLRDGPVEPEELRESRDYLLGVFPYTFQTVSGLVGRLADLAVHGLPDDFWRRSLDEIAATTAEDLLALARRHFDPERLIFVAAGPAGVIAPQLAGLGEVEVLQPA
jgi:zinc protease